MLNLLLALTSLPYAENKCGYACSDSYAGTKVGYPSALVVVNKMIRINKEAHTIWDTIDRLDFNHMLQHAQLGLGFAYELGMHVFE